MTSPVNVNSLTSQSYEDSDTLTRDLSSLRPNESSSQAGSYRERMSPLPYSSAQRASPFHDDSYLEAGKLRQAAQSGKDPLAFAEQGPSDRMAREGADQTYWIMKEYAARNQGKELRSQTWQPKNEYSLDWTDLKRAQGFRRHFVDTGASYTSFFDLLDTFYWQEELVPLLDQEGASTTATFFITLKGFIGPAILYMAAAFANGGMVTGIISTVFVCAWNYIAMLQLFFAYQVRVGTYGELAKTIGGTTFELIVDGSLVICQFGLGCTYFIFVTQSIGHAVQWISNCEVNLATNWGIAAICVAQLAIYIPLSMIRKMKKLAGAAIFADIILIFCLGYLLTYLITHLGDDRQGMPPIDTWIGPKFPVFFGIAVFTFEGIPLVLPIGHSIKTKSHFKFVLGGVATIAGSLMIGLGVMGYWVFGPNVRQIIFLDMSQNEPTSIWPAICLLLYPIVVMCSYPIQLLPALGLTEHYLGIEDRTKSTLFRVGVTLFLCFLAIIGGRYFEAVTSLIGAIACIPLGLIYPPFIHYHIAATKPLTKAFDIFCVILGVAAMLYVLEGTMETIFYGEAEVAMECHKHRSGVWE